MMAGSFQNFRHCCKHFAADSHPHAQSATHQAAFYWAILFEFGGIRENLGELSSFSLFYRYFLL